MKIHPFTCADFPGECVDDGVLHLEGAADPVLGSVFLHVERRGDAVTIHFSADVDPADVGALVTAHVAVPVPFDPFAASDP